jgi:hypothetical protein
LGPPGLTGPQGSKGPAGERGTRGKTGAVILNEFNTNVRKQTKNFSQTSNTIINHTDLHLIERKQVVERPGSVAISQNDYYSNQFNVNRLVSLRRPILIIEQPIFIFQKVR